MLTYEFFRYGALVIRDNNFDDIAFLQGDEACELYDLLEECSTDEQVQIILDQYQQ